MRDINLGAARRAARMRSSETLFIFPWFVTRTLGEHNSIDNFRAVFSINFNFVRRIKTFVGPV